MVVTDQLKQQVKSHWEEEPCQTRGLAGSDRVAYFSTIRDRHYGVQPFIHAFADFPSGKGKRVLEIGVGAGTDFMEWVNHGADATGIDLTQHAIDLTREQLQLNGKKASVEIQDCEHMAFPDDSFDIVYSWGVIHHTPDTPQTISEIHRVLRPGGVAKIMLYHVPSVTGWLLWLIHGLGRLKPWLSPRKAIYNHLESPGTKAYTVPETRALFKQFSKVNCETRLGPGDLLLMDMSEKYQGWLARVALRLYPRWLIKRLGNNVGLELLIQAVK